MKLPGDEIQSMYSLLKGISPMFNNNKAFDNLFKAVDEVELDNTIPNMKEKVLDWAYERDILHKENHTKQYIKLVEEVGELGSALLKQDNLKIIDAIGDIRVVITILAKQLEFDDDECLEMAYNEIKNRTGKTINGTFIKDDY